MEGANRRSPVARSGATPRRDGFQARSREDEMATVMVEVPDDAFSALRRSGKVVAPALPSACR